MRISEVLPDHRLQINLSTEFGGSERTTDWAEYYLLTARVTDDVNGLIGSVLTMVDSLTEAPPSFSDVEANTAVWGPFSGPLEPSEYALFVHLDDDTGVYTWSINGRAAGTEDQWTGFVVGQVEPGATADVSRGWFALDFDQVALLDPTSDARGVFVSAYDIAVDDVSASVGFEEFIGDDNEEPVNALYHYEQIDGGDGLMDLAFEHDVNPEDGTGTDELSIIRSRWTASGSGRADAYTTGGDLGDVVANATECWSSTFEAVYYQDSFSPVEEGDPELCAFDEAEWNDHDAAE